MGKGDHYVKKMLRCPIYFADLYNARLFGGRQVIRAEELMPVPGETGIVIMDGKGKRQVRQRRRDIVMRTMSGVHLSILV